MSYLDKLSNDFVIRTGDGKEYKVLWKPGSRNKDFNISEFEFPLVTGTLVKRSEAKGRRFDIEVYFQGENYLEDSQAFELSANDPRNWIVLHPFYGRIVCAPLGLRIDDSSYNVSQITTTIVETITEERPKITIDPVDKITFDQISTDELAAVSFANNVVPVTTDIVAMQANNATLYNLGKKKVKLSVDAEEYFNLFNEANAAVLDATADPLAAMRAVQAMINKPAQFADSVQNRVNLLLDQMDLLRDSLEGITSPSQKRIFESSALAIVSAMALASATAQADDYESRRDVFDVSDRIKTAYDRFLTDLDGLQTETGGSPDSYIPDAEAMIALGSLMDFMSANLSTIALGSRQERTILLEDDSNAILLTHRFYGADSTDVTLEKFIQQNNIGINEILQIKKGREIVYYV